MVFNNAVDVRKIYPDSKPMNGNQTPLGDRTKPLAARSAMGGQYTAVVPSKIDDKGNKISIETKQLSRQQKSISEVITESRQNNFRDVAIRDYLIRLKGFNAKDVDSALSININLFDELPNSFKNIDGGACIWS